MSDTRTHVLRIGHGTSRGRDTYGYPIVSLTDETTGARVRCMGGGYDMTGTVLADWAGQSYPDRLLTLAGRAYYVHTPGRELSVDKATDSLYGVWSYCTADGTPERVSIDGGSGIDSVWRALEAAGIRQATRTHDRRGNTTGWIVEVPA